MGQLFTYQFQDGQSMIGQEIWTHRGWERKNDSSTLPPHLCLLFDDELFPIDALGKYFMPLGGN